MIGKQLESVQIRMVLATLLPLRECVAPMAVILATVVELSVNILMCLNQSFSINQTFKGKIHSQ